MSHHVLFGLASIIVLGIGSQWAAWRLHLPSILLLLAAGIVAGPVTGFLDPQELFKDLLLPIVSLSVAVILYEGGLSLKIRELRTIGALFVRLTTIGVLVSWTVTAIAAHLLLGFRWPLAALFGAILVVTGPTVIGPLLRHLRLGGQVGSLLKWEGIVIDPVGAILAVLVFSVVRGGETRGAITDVALDFGLTLLMGTLLGCLGAGLLTLSLRRYWIPDPLQNAVSLMLVIATHTAANLLQEESGLLAVTVMGIALANQRWVAIRHLVEFKENLTVLLISSLFIILAARLELEDFTGLGLDSFLFLGALILVARPAAVLLSTIGSTLTWQERLFLAWMAPRGIVAVAVTSVFALQMVAAGFPRAAEMVPVTFLVVFGTVLLYGLSAASLARRLGLVRPNPQGVLFVGAQSWVRALAHALQAEGCPVLLVDTDWENICFARMAGLPIHYGSILAEQTMHETDFSELGRLLAMTSNNEVNSLACLRYTEVFGRREVYQLPFAASADGRHEAVPLDQRGRFLFGPEMNYAHLQELFGPRPMVKKTRLTKEFDFVMLQAMRDDTVVPLFLLDSNGVVTVLTADTTPHAEPGQVLFSIGVAHPARTGQEERESA
ncbi:MAG: sodium:proton antiporter [Planctomycetes bacterium]|nr:sodium:proton antiporter [Planctomycetota bacterium]